jgi:hypothetical protein
MSIITVLEVAACTHKDKDVVSDNDLSSHAPANLAITESELMCDEMIIPEFHLPGPLLSTTEGAETRLLAFETAEMALLYPTPTACGKRSREDSEKFKRIPNQTWLSWIDWGHFA